MYIYTSRYLLLMMLFLPFRLLSQTDSTHITAPAGKNIFSASVNYQSRLHYYGRTDSLQSSGLFPGLGFELKMGLYASGNFIFIQNAVQPTDYVGTTLEGGYRFSTKHFNGNIFYTQFFYKDKTLLVQAALKSQTGLNFAYTNKIINVNTGASLKFSDKTDAGVAFGLDHIFIIKTKVSKVAFAIAPSAYLNAGTQNFTNTYLKDQDIAGIPVNQQQVTENVRAFNLLDYEFSLPLVVVIGKFNASVTPAFVMPQNLIIVANHPELSEYGKNLFSVTLSAEVRL
jgi:hypothetical protein